MPRVQECQRCQDSEEVRLFLRQRQGRRQPHDEGHARRQGRGPRRDDQRRAAGAGRLHDLHRRLQSSTTPTAASCRRTSRPRWSRQLRKLEKAAGAELGSEKKPLLVSVRSGAKFSMPGMMDTILNLGLNDETVEGLKAWTGNGRFAFDSYRRFIQMFGSVVLEIPKAAFEHEFEAIKHAKNAKLDTDLDEAALRDVVGRLQEGRQGPDQEGLPAGSDGSTARRPQRRVPLVEQRAREGISPHLRHSGFDRHGRQRADDGVRQHRRSLGHGRRLHAQPRDRREGILR